MSAPGAERQHCTSFSNPKAPLFQPHIPSSLFFPLLLFFCASPHKFHLISSVHAADRGAGTGTQPRGTQALSRRPAAPSRRLPSLENRLPLLSSSFTTDENDPRVKWTQCLWNCPLDCCSQSGHSVT
ncbi:hypothetical protein GN956_G6354 [Arapaima gigas]